MVLKEMQQSLLSTVGTMGPLQRTDHWGNMLWFMDSVNSAKDIKKQRIENNVKSVQSGFFPGFSRKVFVLFSSSENLFQFCGSCIGKKSFFAII